METPSRSLGAFIDRLHAKRFIRFAIGAISLVAFFVFGPAIRFDFSFLDDALLITENPFIREISPQTLLKIFTTYDPELYIPLTLLTYQIDFMLGGGSPFWFHLQSLLWHAANTVLVLTLAFQITRQRMIAILVALFFLLHPIQVEAVAWVSARKDLVSGFFALLSLVFFIAFKDGSKRSHFVLSIISFVLGLLAKVSILFLPVILLLIEDFRGERLTKKSFRSVLPFFTLSALFGVIALVGKSDGSPVPFDVRILLGMRSIVVTLQHLFVPSRFSVFYPAPLPIDVSEAPYATAIVLVILITFFAFIMRRWSRVPFFAWAFFLCFLVPSLLNLSKDGQHFVTSDRYAYLAGIGVFFGGTVLACHVSASVLRHRKGRLQHGANFSLAALLAVLSVSARASLWRFENAETLARSSIAFDGSVPQAWLGLGNALLQKGSAAEARESFARASELRPEDPESHYGLALALEAQGKKEEALLALDRAVALEPSYALAHINRGKILYALGRKSEALVAFASARDAAPHLALPSFNLAVLASEAGNAEKAEALYREALAKDPAMLDALLNLAQLYIASGRALDARGIHARMRSIAPEDRRTEIIGSLLNGGTLPIFDK